MAYSPLSIRVLHPRPFLLQMSSVLKKQETEFLRAYRAHMYSVQKELAQLRAKADDAAVQLAKNERIRQLEAERDWYRTEALRLDQFCTGLKADVESMVRLVTPGRNVSPPYFRPAMQPRSETGCRLSRTTVTG